MRPTVSICWVLVVALATSGCFGGRRGGVGDDDDDDDYRGGDDDGSSSNDGTGDDPIEELCAGNDPLPTVIEARLVGTYWVDGTDSVDAVGLVSLALAPGDWQYDVEGTMEVTDTGTRPLASCADGTGSATCYGGLSVTFCNGDGYFSFDVTQGTGSWSYYDSAGSAFGSGEVTTVE